MKINKKWFIFLLLVLVMAAMSTAVFADIANITASYSISKSVVAGGGHQPFTDGGGYSLSGTVGQTAVKTVTDSGGYTVNSGFWNGGAAASYAIYLPTIIK